MIKLNVKKKTMMDLWNFCSMLVPRCLKQTLSELQPVKAIGIYREACKKWPNLYMN